MTTATAAADALHALTGNPEATFHPGQYEAIEALVDRHSRALVVQRTGWGKSAVYFISALLIRAAGGGPAVIVSPLIALMRDQVSAAGRAGVRAAAISSANVTEWDAILEALAADEIDVLLISPERLNNPKFRERVLPDLLARMGLLVVDEAHCISDWGHDFRPDYRRIGALLRELGPKLPVLATTATANARVVADVADQLGEDVSVFRGPLSRASLRLGVGATMPPAERLAWLGEHIGDFEGSGIVYTLTVSGAEDTARRLRELGHDVAAYTGGTDPEERAKLEEDLKANRLKALIATSALGMGFDKPDLGFVVHLGAPSSAVAYYQQVGRAGRATDSADVLLLPGPEDPDIWEYFATASMPRQEYADAVLASLGDEPMSVPRLETLVEIKRGTLELLLKVLQVDGAVERVQGGYVSTGRAWTYDAERYATVARARRDEARAMLEYESTSGCRMAFLIEQLDGADAEACGRCDNCAEVWWDATTRGESLEAARTALRTIGLPLAPRSTWPSGLPAIGVELKGRIPPGEQTEEGRVIARLTDLGPGGRLREVFAAGAEDAPPPDDVLAWVVEVLRDWDWGARPDAVVAVPSAKHPRLVAGLAEAIARIGRLENLGTLVRRSEPGSPDVNSAFRVRELHEAYALTDVQSRALPGRRVLLVDDEVVSRWTMALAGRALRRAGADAVLPFALAQRA